MKIFEKKRKTHLSLNLHMSKKNWNKYNFKKPIDFMVFLTYSNKYDYTSRVV